MTRDRPGRRRQRGTIDRLPSGALRVRVYAGTDPVTGRRHDLVEVVPPGSRAETLAEEARTRLLNQVDERRHPRTSATLNQLLDRHFQLVTLERSTLATYLGYADKHIRPLIGAVQVGALDADVFDSFYAELRRCRDHCGRRRYVEHRTTADHGCDTRCRPHECRPLGVATIRQIHFILSGALKRAVRWRWIAANPIRQAEPPPAPKPNPQPPTAEEAARILEEAWADLHWGTLIWLVMVTGVRRGELCALRWRDVDLVGGVLSLRHSIGQRNRQTWEKDTKTHQHRRIALDPETVSILTEHRRRWSESAAALDVELSADAFVFSLAPDGSTYLRPNSVSERYSDLAERLGIRTSLHKLRHYTATELIAAGVDVRTVAGRLGHGGGGTTTLKVYAAWVSESDQRAATSLFARMPARPVEPAKPAARVERPPAPYERIAAALRSAIGSGTIGVGQFLPSVKAVAAEHGVSVGTASRATSLLREWGLVEVVSGRGVRVVEAAAPDEPSSSLDAEPGAGSGGSAGEPPGPLLLSLEIRHRGATVARLTAEADPRDAGPGQDASGAVSGVLLCCCRAVTAAR
jgi:integrase